MADNGHTSSRLLGTLVSGAKEIPRNASWLAGKALPHNGTGNGHGQSSERSGSRSLVRRAGDAVRDALPGQDSVESRLGQARDGADRARDAEDRAVEAAERAHELTQQVDVVESEEKRRLQEVKGTLSEGVQQRLRAAERQAEEHVARVRGEAEADAERRMSEEEEVSAQRVEAVRAEAVRAQHEAHERFAEATERLARARELADEAAALAQEAAERARTDAERISAAVASDRQNADQALTQAHQLRERTEKEAATVTRAVNRTTSRSGPGALSTMSKSDLLQLAQKRDLSGRSSMSKKQLIAALEKKQ